MMTKSKLSLDREVSNDRFLSLLLANNSIILSL